MVEPVSLTLGAIGFAGGQGRGQNGRPGGRRWGRSAAGPPGGLAAGPVLEGRGWGAGQCEPSKSLSLVARSRSDRHGQLSEGSNQPSVWCCLDAELTGSVALAEP